MVGIGIFALLIEGAYEVRRNSFFVFFIFKKKGAKKSTHFNKQALCFCLLVQNMTSAGNCLCLDLFVVYSIFNELFLEFCFGCE